mgnify:CR=1 FL=1
MNDITPTSTLPKIVQIVSVTDHGPCDPEPTAHCPHCGAPGRYVYTFRCEDGSTRGAMKGCIQLFPMHPLASYAKFIAAKTSKNKPLNRWDEAISKAINDFLEKRTNENTAISICRSQVTQRKAWIANRYGGRR